MRHHLPPPRGQKRARDDQKDRLFAREDAHEHHAGGVRALPAVHQADRLPRPDRSIDTDYGKKIDTDLTWCVNDGACERVKASNEYGTHVKPCPSFEQVTIVRKKRKRYLLPKHGFGQAAAAGRLRPTCCLTPGSGLPRAPQRRGRDGHRCGERRSSCGPGTAKGFDVAFCDKKGLAIRNGGVYAQVTYARRGGKRASIASARG